MRTLKKLIPQQLKNVYHLGLAIFANSIYGFPSRKLKVVGITGTDGKTTTTQMVVKILEEAGKKVAMASTINFKIGEREWINSTKFTTRSSFATQKFIKHAVAAGCEYLVLETSSHSLDQHRVWGIRYQVAVITNITREHLDYHKTMEAYRKAKEKLFSIVAKNNGTIIVNLDMEKPEDFLAYDAASKYGYTTNSIDPIQTSIEISDQKTHIIQAENVQLGIQNTTYNIQHTDFEIRLPGLFNVENALAATCVGLNEQIKPETISKALGNIVNVPGRMELIPNEKKLNIIVDFALTPEALTKLYSLIDQTKQPNAKVIGVFGSCGERDRGKRPIMGKIVSEHADCVILTNDEPYHEDPQQIIAEIAAGITNKKINENYWQIPDRRAAIAKALNIAQPGDVILVTGMGAEDTMAVGDKKIPWNDKEVILEELQK